MTDLPSKSNSHLPESENERLPSSIARSLIPESSNAEPSICCTESGIVKETSDQQPEKAPLSIDLQEDGDSNVNVASRLQPAKQSKRRAVTELGMEIDGSI
jgi:hypothetical protein